MRSRDVPTAARAGGRLLAESSTRAATRIPYIRDYTTGLPCSASDTRGCFQDGGVLGKIPANRLYALGLNALKIYPTPNGSYGGGPQLQQRGAERRAAA